MRVDVARQIAQRSEDLPYLVIVGPQFDAVGPRYGQRDFQRIDRVEPQPLAKERIIREGFVWSSVVAWVSAVISVRAPDYCLPRNMAADMLQNASLSRNSFQYQRFLPHFTLRRSRRDCHVPKWNAELAT